MKIKIYKSSWQATREPQQDFTRLFCSISNKLKEKYENVKVINLPHKNNELTIQGISASLYDCELLIDTGDAIKLLSFADILPQSFKFLFERNNKNDVLAWSSYQKFKSSFLNYDFKIKLPSYIQRNAFYDLDAFYDYKLDNFWELDKFTFRGNYGSLPRNVIQSLKTKKYEMHFSYPHQMSAEEYLKDMLLHKVGLSISGASEFCFRDIEYMGVGLPMLRFEYISKWNPDLIPNYHYIAVSRLDSSQEEEWFCGKENLQNGFVGQNEYTDLYADAYYNRFLEVKDDIDFLKFISKNARNYYNNFLHPSTRVNNILNLLEL